MKEIFDSEKINIKMPLLVIFTIFFMSFSGAQVSEHKNIETTIESNSEFPKFINTGNPELDNQKYKESKEAWILANPEVYQRMNSNKLIVVSKTEFESMPIEKQNDIKNHPEKYILK